MGIYRVKSKTCNCKGSWSTLDPRDRRVYLDEPCKKHKLSEGNTIYYELKHLLVSLINDINEMRIKEKYEVKILKVQKLDNNKTIIKIEVNHEGDLNIDKFNNNKQIYYSQMNDEPMWKQIDNNIIHMIILYRSPHHTVEETWEKLDY